MTAPDELTRLEKRRRLIKILRANFRRDASTRQFDVVMAWSVDRLGRSLQDLIAFLSDLPYSIWSILEPSFDLGTGVGRMRVQASDLPLARSCAAISCRALARRSTSRRQCRHHPIRTPSPITRSQRSSPRRAATCK